MEIGSHGSFLDNLDGKESKNFEGNFKIKVDTEEK